MCKRNFSFFSKFSQNRETTRLKDPIDICTITLNIFLFLTPKNTNATRIVVRQIANIRAFIAVSVATKSIRRMRRTSIPEALFAHPPSVAFEFSFIDFRYLRYLRYEIMYRTLRDIDEAYAGTRSQTTLIQATGFMQIIFYGIQARAICLMENQEGLVRDQKSFI